MAADGSRVHAGGRKDRRKGREEGQAETRTSRCTVSGREGNQQGRPTQALGARGHQPVRHPALAPQRQGARNGASGRARVRAEARPGWRTLRACPGHRHRAPQRDTDTAHRNGTPREASLRAALRRHGRHASRVAPGLRAPPSPLLDTRCRRARSALAAPSRPTTEHHPQPTPTQPVHTRWNADTAARLPHATSKSAAALPRAAPSTFAVRMAESLQDFPFDARAGTQEETRGSSSKRPMTIGTRDRSHPRQNKPNLVPTRSGI